MRRGVVSRRAGEGWQFGWIVEMAIAVGLMSFVGLGGLAGFVDVANAGDLGGAGNLGSAAKSGGASDVAGGGRSGIWTDLWATREQQAQRLLESQRPAEAAALFGDPRRRAYAELRAGQYEKAAQQLAPFKDVDSQYNRGNALAHAGKLRDALAAYDSALAQSPGNSDVTRNRELVARALEEQNRGNQKPNGGKSQSDGKGGQGQSNGGQQGDGANAANGPKRDDANSDGQSRSGGQQQAGNSGEPGNQGQAANQPQGGKPGDLSEAARLAQRAKDKDADSAAAKAQRQAQAQGQGQAQTQPQSQTQAQALADAGQRGGANSPGRDLMVNKARASADEPPQQPRSEQSLALDQWLRGIPEDSGELLRRKFMIEHMMKQQGYQP